MIDHLTLTVRDLASARQFFDAALAPLGYAMQREFSGIVGYGAPGKPALWLRSGPVGSATHLAFIAPDHAAVDRFHAAALAAGASDNGAPGPRPHYHANFYGAFVIDPDGNNLEAVDHRPPGAKAKAAVAARRVAPAKSKSKPKTRPKKAPVKAKAKKARGKKR